MRLLVSCKSVLLQKSITSFLKLYIVDDIQSAEFVVTDHMLESHLPLFIISNNEDMSSMGKPFSRSNLLLKVEEFYNRLEKQKEYKNEDFKTLNLEQKIELLTKEYNTKLMHLMQDDK